MSFFKRLLGSKSADEWMAEADEHFQAERYGDAKLAYDRAAAAGDGELAERAAKRSEQCRDALAEARMKEAQRLASKGVMELAFEELREAADTAASEEMQSKVRALAASLERKDAVEAASEGPAEMSEEERFAVIAGSWEPLQAEELEEYGDELVKAIVALESGDGKTARPLLDELVSHHEEASYLWLEVGRARLLDDDDEGARQALEKFLSRIAPDEGGAARLGAHNDLAALRHRAGDEDGAIAHLENACEALEDDPRPYHALGNYLLQTKRPAEAAEVLEMCAGQFGDGQVEWPVSLSLGVALSEAGQQERAVAVLEGALEILVARGTQDFPPALAVALAQVQEQSGNPTRAADLFRALAQGSDTENHLAYHREAARLLHGMGLEQEAQRMAERALALAGDDPEAQALVRSALEPESPPAST